MHLVDIQSFWEIPYISHFCSLFRSQFKLPEFDIEDLEEALLADGKKGDVLLLSELIIALLNGCDVVRHTVRTSNYQMFLWRVLHRKCNEYKLQHTFDKDTDFHSLPLRTKISNLHLLCDIRLDSADVGRIYNSLDPGSLRVGPLGSDAKGSTYWYFHGTRLYREDKVKSSKDNSNEESSVWQVICFTEDDWNKFSNSLNNRRENERVLRQLIETDFLPKIRLIFLKSKMSRRQKLIKLRDGAAAREEIYDSWIRRRRTT